MDQNTTNAAILAHLRSLDPKLLENLLLSAKSGLGSSNNGSEEASSSKGVGLLDQAIDESGLNDGVSLESNVLVHVVDSVIPDKFDDGGKVGKDMPLLDCVESSSCVDEGLNSAVNTDVKDGVEEENLESVNEILKWFDGKPLNNKSCEEKKWQHDVDAEFRKNTDVVESPNVATGIKSPIGTGNK